MLALVLAVLALGQDATPTGAAPPDDDLRVYTDAPRLFLTPARLRLLQRERDRKSLRWEQFDLLMSGGAKLPEPGFAGALYYRVAGDAGAGRRAVAWALGVDSKDLRQLALVFDWCGPVMTAAQSEQLVTKIQKALAGITMPTDANLGVDQRRALVLGTVAIADRFPDHGEAALKPIVAWWRDLAGKLETGEASLPRTDTYALFEMLHAIRDNLKIDLRDDARRYFRDLPLDHMASHYPAAFPAPENEYRVPVFVRDGEPDVTEATMSRAAELAMVAFDANEAGNQYLQGWLTQDRFLMRGALGASYEFLWANPYQPGLSFSQAPLMVYDPVSGHLFARTSWDEDATWIGYFDGHLQLYRDGRITVLRTGATSEPVQVGNAVILTMASPDAGKFHLNSPETYVLGLAPKAVYELEIDDEELSEVETDKGGTLVLTLPAGIDADVRIRKR